MKPTIVYILAAGHSGTTILQYLLASGRGTLGLGEVRKLAGGSDWEACAETCSCGVDFKECPAWSDVKPAAGESNADWYRRVVDTLSRLYPETTHWIDSSKTPEGLEPWLDLLREGVVGDIRLLFLVRDVRGWVVSDQRARKRKNRRGRPAPVTILSWWRAQAAIQKFLTTSGLDYRVLSYEGMNFRTGAVMKRIADYTNIAGLERSWETELRHAEVHDVYGNRVKNDASMRSRLVYDDEWRYRASLTLLSWLVWPAWRMNSRLHTRALGARD